MRAKESRNLLRKLPTATTPIVEKTNKRVYKKQFTQSTYIKKNSTLTPNSSMFNLPSMLTIHKYLVPGTRYWFRSGNRGNRASLHFSLSECFRLRILVVHEKLRGTGVSNTTFSRLLLHCWPMYLKTRLMFKLISKRS